MIKTYVNGQENGVITYKGDTEPCAVYVVKDGVAEKQENLSYKSEPISGVNSVEYSSEYKKNICTMQIDGNTEQYQKKGTTYPFDLYEWVETNVPILGSKDEGTVYTPYICWQTPIPLPTAGKFRLDVNYLSKVIPTDQLNIVIAYSESDIDTRTGSYKVVYPYTEPVFVDQSFYLGAINPSGNIDMTDNDMWQKYIYAISSDTTVSFIEDSVPSPYAPSPIKNAGDLPIKCVLRTNDAEYQQVEYIESSGTQYINTGVKPTKKTGVEIVYNSLKTSVTSQYILGARQGNSSSTVAYAINGSSSSEYWDVRFNGVTIALTEIKRAMGKYKSTLTPTDSGGMVWTLENLSTTGRTYQKTISSISVTTNVSLFIFAYGATNAAQTACHEKLRVYGCKIYDNGNLIRDFIPCYRKSDNEAGLFDVVNSVFYENQGTGEFKKGANVGISNTLKKVEVEFPSSVTVDGQEVQLRFGMWDKLLVDRVSGKVTYTEGTLYENVSSQAFIDRTASSFTEGRRWFQMSPTRSVENGLGYCNIVSPTTTDYGNYNHFRVSGTQIAFIIQGFTSLAEFNTYKASNPIIIQCKLREPIEHILYDKANNITTELGQQILDFVNSTQNATNIIEITSTPSVSNLSVNYAKWGGKK